MKTGYQVRIRVGGIEVVGQVGGAFEALRGGWMGRAVVKSASLFVKKLHC